MRRDKGHKKARPQTMAQPSAKHPKKRPGRRPWGRYILLLGVVAGVGGATWWTVRRFDEAPAFQVEHLEVNGARMTTVEEIRRASDLHYGESVFAIDLAAVEQRIERLPWVRKALVQRKPPDRLVVVLEERKRLAWIDLGAVYCIDQDQVLLPGERQQGEALSELNLPLISGVEGLPDSLQVGASLGDSVLAELVGWWSQVRSLEPDWCMNVSEIQPLPQGCLRLLLVGDDLEVRLPLDKVPYRLRLLKQCLLRVFREWPDPKYLDLRFSGQVVVGTRAAKGNS